jgi:hypothetical protein
MMATLVQHYAGIVDIRGAQVSLEEGYPKQVWGGTMTSRTSSGSKPSSSSSPRGAAQPATEEGVHVNQLEDTVMHYLIKVDRYANFDQLSKSIFCLTPREHRAL